MITLSDREDVVVTQVGHTANQLLFSMAAEQQGWVEVPCADHEFGAFYVNHDQCRVMALVGNRYEIAQCVAPSVVHQLAFRASRVGGLLKSVSNRNVA